MLARRAIWYLLAVTMFAAPAGAGDAVWPQWRGPDGQGHAINEASDLPVEWSIAEGEEKNIAWKTKLPGVGWSSPVVEGDHVWMTAAVGLPASEEVRQAKLAKDTGNQPLDIVGDLSLRAICVHLGTGKLLHDIELMKKVDPQPTHSLNSFASPSPIIRDGQLYCHFGAYGSCRLDTASGKVVWRRQDLVIAHETGPGSTPVLWKNLLIVHQDGSDLQYVIALDAKTGETVWRTDRSGEMHSNPQQKKSFCTPLVVEMGGTEQLISPGSDWLYSYDPATGKELWKINYGVLGFSIVPRPVVGNGMIYIATGFMKSQVMAFKIQGAEPPKLMWTYNRQVSRMPSPILVGEELYILSDRGGILTCLDAITGNVNYVERLGGNHASSPIFADGRLYFSSREGVTVVVQPGTQYEPLAENELDGPIMATPAVADHALIIRTKDHLYRIGRRASATK